MSSEKKFVEENIRRVLLKETIKKEIERAGFGGIEIRRTPHGTRITLTVERPGLVIGRKGMTIKKLTTDVEEKFGLEKPQIEVRDAENPNTNAQIMAQKLASALERGWHFRRAGHSTVRRIMDGGAKGCMIILSGKLTGQRHRTEKFSHGHIKYCGDTALKWMDNGFAVAKKKLGIIGVKVMIMDPNARLPDEVTIVEPDEVEKFVMFEPVEEDETEEDGKKEEAVIEMLKEAKEEAEEEKEDTKKEDEGKKDKGKKGKGKKGKKTTKSARTRKDEGEEKVEEKVEEKAEEKAEEKVESGKKVPDKKDQAGKDGGGDDKKDTAEVTSETKAEVEEDGKENE